MIKTWMLWLSFIIYPIIIFGFNFIIKRRIPEKSVRKQFKEKNEYIIRMVYLLAPLLILHFELLFLKAGFSFSHINKGALILLFLLQIILFLTEIGRASCRERV